MEGDRSLATRRVVVSPCACTHCKRPAIHAGLRPLRERGNTVVTSACSAAAQSTRVCVCVCVWVRACPVPQTMPPKKKAKASKDLSRHGLGGENAGSASSGAVATAAAAPPEPTLKASIDQVVDLADQALDLLKSTKKPQPWLTELRAEISKLEERQDPVPCVGFLTKPNYGKSYLTNKLLTGDAAKGPCVHGERAGGGVTTIPVAFLSQHGQLAASRGGPDLEIGEECGVYAIDLEGVLVEKDRFFEPLKRRDSPDRVYKKIAEVTTANDPEKQRDKSSAEGSEIEVGMYVVRYPFKNLELPASSSKEPARMLTCRDSRGKIEPARTNYPVAKAQRLSFIEVPGMETANDEKLKLRLHLALSFLDIILVGLEDKDWRLEKHFLEPLRECAWLGKVEKAEHLPSVVFCANADRSQHDAHDYVEAALAYCGKDSVKDPENRSPLNNVYEVFRQGLNADLEDPRAGDDGQEYQDGPAVQHPQTTHALNQISEVTELWELAPVEVATQLLSTLDTFVFASAHWDSVLVAFARMTAEKAGQLLALRERDWAETARKLQDNVLLKISKTAKGLQRNQVVAMAKAQNKLKQYIPDSTDFNRPATKFTHTQKFGYTHKIPYQVSSVCCLSVCLSVCLSGV